MQQGEAFITTRNEEETAHIGAVLGRRIEEPLVITARYGGLISGSRSSGVWNRETAPMTRMINSMVIVATGRRTERRGKFKSLASLNSNILLQKNRCSI